MRRKSGFAFHCHHDVLVEHVWDYDKRVNFIKENKPPNEIELRLRLFKLIPNKRLPAKLNKAWALSQPMLEQLHKELCPNCPWDGETIFPKNQKR